MSITVFRILNARFSSSAFDGEGARLYGGRWNSIGTKMVYAAQSRSLAILEILVHIEDNSILQEQYDLIPISFPKQLVTQLTEDELPDQWNSPEPIAQSQALGDAWVRDCRSAILEVPSAVCHGELNYLLNPAHPDFTQISIGAPMQIVIDPRLIQSMAPS